MQDSHYCEQRHVFTITSTRICTCVNAALVIDPELSVLVTATLRVLLQLLSDDFGNGYKVNTKSTDDWCSHTQLIHHCSSNTSFTLVA